MCMQAVVAARLNSNASESAVMNDNVKCHCEAQCHPTQQLHIVIVLGVKITSQTALLRAYMC